MNNLEKEITLAQLKLHWGIFVPVVMTATLFLVAMIPMVVMIRAANDLAHQFNAQVSNTISCFLLILILLPEIVIALPLLLLTLAAYSKSSITLTNRRLIFRTGLLARVQGELPLENMEMILLNEPPLGRLLGYGTLTVTSLGGLRFPLRYVASPIGFHAALQQAVAAAKSPVNPSPPPASTGLHDDSPYMPKE